MRTLMSSTGVDLVRSGALGALCRECGREAVEAALTEAVQGLVQASAAAPGPRRTKQVARRRAVLVL